jgi:kinesin family protein C1
VLPDTSQKQIFGEVEKLVQSAIDGFNVCIFAYGQTGSGKTYTMSGSGGVGDGDGGDNSGGLGEHLGVIPRTAELLGRLVEELRCMGWDFKIEASMLEIYNEKIRDLLRRGRSVRSEAINQSLLLTQVLYVFRC